MREFDEIGADWLLEQIDSMVEGISHSSPVEFNERNRYIPSGLSRRSGYIRYSLFPFLREILECFSIFSDVREVNVMKGVQTGYTTLLESILLYVIGEVKTAPTMYLTADRELAVDRIENNIIPMINESGLSSLIRSSDVGNPRKTGKTSRYIQWDGGGYLNYNGAKNAAKMRQMSAQYLLKDELDAWPRAVGKDGNSDNLTNARASTYWDIRKILRGSTPLIEPSLIGEAYSRGDQRVYLVLCRACSYPQQLQQRYVNPKNGVIGGFHWDLEEDKTLIIDSVRYCCINCGHEHYERDKEKLFSLEEGAHWHPTARPREPGIRSYHLPAFYSPYGFQPWYKCISSFLDCYDVDSQIVISFDKYQEYRNNIEGLPFKILGSRVTREQASLLRRTFYAYGQIPNRAMVKYSHSKALVLICTVDVHKSNLAVGVFAFTSRQCCYLIDYWRFEDEDCTLESSPAWNQLRELIEDREYVADDGSLYRVAFTFIDCNFANDTVVGFCNQYAMNVYPIVGKSQSGRRQTIKEFSEFQTTIGTTGYSIWVDYYKFRLAPVLRREWLAENGPQLRYHFNVPFEASDKQLKELTAEYLQEKTDSRGEVYYEWYRPGNKPNELWDLLTYASCGFEIVAWQICVQHFELDSVDWTRFFNYLESEKLFFAD